MLGCFLSSSESPLNRWSNSPASSRPPFGSPGSAKHQRSSWSLGYITLELISSSRLSTLNRQVITILAEEATDAEKRAARMKLEAELALKHSGVKEP